MRRLITLSTLTLIASASLSSAAERPNLVVILADDLGYETIGANGGTSYRTPALDELAATGARFSEFYAQPLCTPTRVQLMTGLSNARNYFAFGAMDPQAVTFSSMLKTAGYATCIAGKWQLGRDRDLPRQLGFDEFYLWNHTRRPPRYANPGLEINGVEKNYTNGEYGPDLINAFALDFISRNKNRPFLLYYSMILPHTPHQPTPDSESWDPSAKGELVNTHDRHFAEMVEYADKLVESVVTKLEALHLRNKTLILFLADNGTAAGMRSMMGDRVVIGGKGSTTAAGMHVPLIANWPGHVAAGKTISDLVDSTDVAPTLLEAAGVKPGAALALDGRSFLPQLRGEKGQPRDWIYSWYSPRESADMGVVEFAFDQRFKLYRTGEFFDLDRDPEEKTPLSEAILDRDAAVAAKRLRMALGLFRNVRPARLDRLGQEVLEARRKARAEAP